MKIRRGRNRDVLELLQRLEPLHLNEEDRWAYSFTLTLVQTLGYETVSSAIDEAMNPDFTQRIQIALLRQTAVELNEDVRAKKKKEAK